MWVFISTKTKTIVLPHKNKGGNTAQIISTQTPTIVTENTENLPNLSSYTIEYQIVRNSHLLSQNWHFLKCHSNCSTNKHKLLTYKIIKAAIDCSYVYCEGKYGKVLQTHTFSLQMHYCVHWCLKVNRYYHEKYKTNKVLHIIQITTKNIS